MPAFCAIFHKENAGFFRRPGYVLRTAPGTESAPGLPDGAAPGLCDGLRQWSVVTTVRMVSIWAWVRSGMRLESRNRMSFSQHTSSIGLPEEKVAA